MISELIREFRYKVYDDTGRMPKYLYLGPQVYEDLLEEAEKYRKSTEQTYLSGFFPKGTLAGLSLKFSPPPKTFMGMTIVERADWPSLMIVLAHTPVPDCFEPEELIASLKNPKERRTVH
jgi:hypothetical protein